MDSAESSGSLEAELPLLGIIRPGAHPSGTYYFYISVVGTQSGMNIRVTAQ